jgi:hypothetical protein
VTNNPLSIVDPLGLDYSYCSPAPYYDEDGKIHTTTICNVYGEPDGCVAEGTEGCITAPPPSGPPPPITLGGGPGSSGLGGSSGTAPSNQNRLHCAAQFANQFSIAGITGLDNYHGFGSTLLNAALGNTFSGFVDAFDAGTGQNGKSGFDLYPMGVAGGPLLGIPLPDSASPGLQGPLNTALAPAINAATTTSVTTLAGETAIGDSMAFPLAAAKFALDGLTFAAGYIGCHP